jgi:hypothetical protein
MTKPSQVRRGEIRYGWQEMDKGRKPVYTLGIRWRDTKGKG